MKYFILTVFLWVSYTGMAQMDTYQKDIIELLNLNGMREDCSVAYHEVFPKLERNFKDKGIPKEAWTKLKSDEERQVDNALKQLSFAYRNNFTHEEIQEMLEFYTTKVAQKTLSGAELSKEEDKALNKFLKSDVGKKMKSQRKKLNADIDPIMDQWERDLFAAKMKQLVIEGYL